MIIMAPKKRKTISNPAPPPPPPQTPRKFVTKAAEDDYPFFDNTPSVLERGFTSITINFAE